MNQDDILIREDGRVTVGPYDLWRVVGGDVYVETMNEEYAWQQAYEHSGTVQHLQSGYWEETY